MVFLAFFKGVGLAVAFRLPARVIKVLALTPVEGSLVDSSPGGRPKTRMAGIRIFTVKVGNGRDEAIQCLHSDEKDIRFQENKTSSINQGTLPSLFPPPIW
jgi:hypothetical protein